MSVKPVTERVSIAGPAGHLEAVLEAPAAGEATACAVVCHPHPLHGGTMDNKVVHTLSRAFLRRGFSSLRFNFRGTGASDGEFDDGKGELEDVSAAAGWMRQHAPGLPLWLAGFSFGAAMAVRAAADLDPAGLVSIAPATSRFAATLERQPRCPWLIVQGDEDELVPVDETVAWVNSLEPGPELKIFPDTEHFFHGRLVLLRAAVEDFVQANAPG